MCVCVRQACGAVSFRGYVGMSDICVISYDRMGGRVYDNQLGCWALEYIVSGSFEIK